MKICRDGIHGSPQEIKDFFDNDMSKLDEYVTKPSSPVLIRWIIIPIMIIIASVVLLVFCNSNRFNLFYFLTGLGGDLWLTVNVNRKYDKNTITITFIVLFVVLIMLLLASGIILPKDSIDYIFKLKS